MGGACLSLMRESLTMPHRPAPYAKYYMTENVYGVARAAFLYVQAMGLPVLVLPVTQRFTEQERVGNLDGMKPPEKVITFKVQDGFLTEEILQSLASLSKYLIINFECVATNIMAMRKQRHLFDIIFLYGKEPPIDLLENIAMNVEYWTPLYYNK